MSDLTDKFEALEAQLASQHTTVLSALASLQASIDLVASNTDILIENGAANTKYLLAAIGQSGACFPCPSPPMIVPPIGTTPGSINTDRCKRAQAFIAVIHALLANMDTMQSFNVIGTYNVVSGAITDYIGTIAAGDTVPLPSAPEAINIVGDYVSYAGERVFSGVGLVEQFSPLETSLIAAIYNTTTPGDAQSSYNAIIEASGVSNGARLMFEAIAYTALWSYYFDPASTPDLSAYDGSVCATGECMTIESQEANISGTVLPAIVWPTDIFTSSTNDGGGTSADLAIWCTTDLAGWSFTPDTNVRFFPGGGSHADVNAGDLFVFGTTTFAAIVNPVDTPFSIELCPPEGG